MLLLDHYKHFAQDPSRPLVLALGNFDGVHRGHQKLLGTVVDRARALGGIAAAFTFQSHPQHLLHPSAKPPLLISEEHKLLLLSRVGIELVFRTAFTEEFSRMEAGFFVEEILVRTLGIKELYLGPNARFGHGRQGDALMAQTLAEKFGFRFGVVSAVTGDDKKIPVSSTIIRDLIRSGRFGEIPEFLGRPFSIFGHVTGGRKRGAVLGYPTANIELRETLPPPEGVYPAFAREIKILRAAAPNGQSESFEESSSGPWMGGAFYFGRRPTFERGEVPAVAEIFLFDFEGDLYGKALEVSIFPRLRGEMTFPDTESLKRQMEKDIARIRDILRRESRIV